MSYRSGLRSPEMKYWKRGSAIWLGAPEIAQAMLRRQQAQAVIAARQKIVEGAMGMVEMALNHIEQKGVVELDEEKKAAMVNNLMVALVSEGETTPVINTGTLFT
jgi:hypothetical protein